MSDTGFRDLQHVASQALGPRAPKPAPIPTEYPKMLVHPEHVPARQPIMHEEIEDQHHLWGAYRHTWTEPGNPERWPNVVVNNEREEGEACALGYRPMGKFGSSAMERLEVPPGFVATVYPKWVAALGRAVDSLEEELRLTGAGAPALPPVPVQAPAPPPSPPPPQELLELRAEIAALRAAQPAQATPATPSIGARNRSEAQARLVAGVSHSAWRRLIRAGFLDAARQTDPVAIVAAQELARQADEAARIAAEQEMPVITTERI